MNSVNTFVVYDDVTFIKGGWINRNKILVNKIAYTFSVPLVRSGSHVLIKDLKVNHELRWQRKFLMTLEQSYKKAPHFRDVYDLISNIISKSYTFIVDMHLNSFHLINSYLGINTSIIDSSSIYQNQHLKGQIRIIDICKKESASDYINSIGGRELYSKQEFDKVGVKLSFMEYNKISYRQYQESFVSGLSIIDVMMFNSVHCIKSMLSNYRLL